MKKPRILVVLLGFVLSAGVLLALGALALAVLDARTTLPTESDSTSLALRIDTSLSSDEAIPLGESFALDQGSRYPIEVTKKRLEDGRLHLCVREWREDGYEVEFWLATPLATADRVRSLVIWSEYSGGERGKLSNLAGTVSVSPDPLPGGAGYKEDTGVLSYELTGVQRDRSVTLARKVKL